MTTDGEHRDRRDTDRIWAALDDIRQNVATLTANQATTHALLQEVRGDLKTMSVNGCAKAVQHADHEQRIRSLETQRNVVAGLSGGGGAVIGSALTAFLNWLKG